MDREPVWIRSVCERFSFFFISVFIMIHLSFVLIFRIRFDYVTCLEI
jgi:hypothetical protein